MTEQIRQTGFEKGAGLGALEGVDGLSFAGWKMSLGWVQHVEYENRCIAALDAVPVSFGLSEEGGCSDVHNSS